MAGRQREHPTVTPYLQETSPERPPSLPPKKKLRKNLQVPEQVPEQVHAPTLSPEVVPDSEEDEEVLYHGFSYPGVEVVQKGNGKRQIRRLEKTVIPRDLTPSGRS